MSVERGALSALMCGGFGRCALKEDERLRGYLSKQTTVTPPGRPEETKREINRLLVHITKSFYTKWW